MTTTKQTTVILSLRMEQKIPPSPRTALLQVSQGGIEKSAPKIKWTQKPLSKRSFPRKCYVQTGEFYGNTIHWDKVELKKLVWATSNNGPAILYVDADSSHGYPGWNDTEKAHTCFTTSGGGIRTCIRIETKKWR
jgi:hypothetical protein